MLTVENIFTKDIEYELCTKHSTDLKQLKTDANFALHLTHGRTFKP